ncbi:hypothetical protein NQ156_09525 [Microbacterium sp. zg.Y625]|uniref:hypothetical protein n=1 Tax=Microbacterium jiangjiandongii TaxID=3049071 RepID=UPI00214BA000|nr:MULTISPECIES: hypothetical protein [unclassified Microbacterium]MCR2793297.1 hypothetical protein [Microbacterium sp. zg.Y625]WIM25326.1 hypothetical protein QNO14_14540 [Microbacterium sp. zg-Y625]
MSKKKTAGDSNWWGTFVALILDIPPFAVWAANHDHDDDEPGPFARRPRPTKDDPKPGP